MKWYGIFYFHVGQVVILFLVEVLFVIFVKIDTP